MKRIIIAVSVLAGIAACNNQDKAAETKPDVLAGNIDSTVRPQDDFFDYANGGWIKG